MGSLVESVYECPCVTERNDDSLDKKAKRNCGKDFHQKVESQRLEVLWEKGILQAVCGRTKKKYEEMRIKRVGRH